MPSISESSAAGQKLIESGVLKYVEPIAAPPAIPAPSTAYPAAPNQYLRAPLPDDFWQQPDAQRQFHAAAIPQTRISPLPDNTSPVAGAQAASQAIQIVQSTPATTTAASGVTSVGLTMPTTLFVTPVAGSPITSSGTLAPVLVTPPIGTVFSAPGSSQGVVIPDSINSTFYRLPAATSGNLIVSTTASQAHGFVLLFESLSEFGGSITDPPGWNIIDALTSGGNGVYWQSPSAAGTISASTAWTSPGIGSFGIACITAIQSNGGTPTVVQNRNSSAFAGSGPGSTVTEAFVSNVTAGNTLFVLVGPTAFAGLSYFVPGVTDSQGNFYTLINTAFSTGSDFSGSTQAIWMFVATASATGANTVTVTNTSSSNLSAKIAIVEVSNLMPPSLTPSFQPLTTFEIPGMSAGTLDVLHGGTGTTLAGTGGAHQYLAQTTAGHSIVVQQPDYNDLLGTSLATRYNSVTLVSNGLPSEVATVDRTAQTAAITTTTLYAVTAGGPGQYRLNWNAKVTTAAGVSSTLGALTIVYTDPDGVAQTITAAAQNSAGTIETTDAGNSTTTVMLGIPLFLNCKASTNITYAFAYASNAAAAMNFNLHMKLESL